MNAQTVSKYSSPLRLEQAEATRERILDAVRTMFEADPETALSFDEVARISGVSRRTVFRHFETKEALLDAFWRRTNEALGVQFWPESESDLTALPPDLFNALDDIEEIIRASHASGTGREMRLRANKERQVAFRRSLSKVSQNLSTKRRKQLEAVVQLLFSATAWQTMRDYWGLTGREAGEAASWAISTLLEAARNEQSSRSNTREKS